MARSKLEIAKILAGIDNLPTLPLIASELLKMLGNFTVSMASISKIMSNDPSITAKVLKIANSAYYSLRKKVDTLRMALVVLGVNEITNIIVSLSLVKMFKAEKNELFDHSVFWKHNVYTAHFSRTLSKYISLPYHGEEFTAGLMHDIGKIVEDQYFHDDFMYALAAFRNTPGLDKLELEKSYIGANHQDLGLWIAEVWKIPKNIQHVIRYHHNPENAEDDKDLVCVVFLSNLFANYFSNEKDYKRDFDNIQNTHAWGHLNKKKALNLDEIMPLLSKEIEIADTFISQMESN